MYSPSPRFLIQSGHIRKIDRYHYVEPGGSDMRETGCRRTRKSSSSAEGLSGAAWRIISPNADGKTSVLLERKVLTCGTTWAAAGLCAQLRATRGAHHDGPLRHGTLRQTRRGNRPAHRVQNPGVDPGCEDRGEKAGIPPERGHGTILRHRDGRNRLRRGQAPVPAALYGPTLPPFSGAPTTERPTPSTPLRPWQKALA